VRALRLRPGDTVVEIGCGTGLNVTLAEADALEFEFPSTVNGIISTYALSLVPECAEAIAAVCGDRRVEGEPSLGSCS